VGRGSESDCLYFEDFISCIKRERGKSGDVVGKEVECGDDVVGLLE